MIQGCSSILLNAIEPRGVEVGFVVLLEASTRLVVIVMGLCGTLAEVAVESGVVNGRRLSAVGMF